MALYLHRHDGVRSDVSAHGIVPGLVVRRVELRRDVLHTKASFTRSCLACVLRGLFCVGCWWKVSFF